MERYGQTKKGKAELNSELFDGLSVRVWHGVESRGDDGIKSFKIDALFFEEETYDLIFTGQTNLIIRT